MRNRKSNRRNFRNHIEARAAEAREEYTKSAFGAACLRARANGWTWAFEGESIIVRTPDAEIVCSDRLDFAAFVAGQ